MRAHVLCALGHVERYLEVAHSEAVQLDPEGHVDPTTPHLSYLSVAVLDLTALVSMDYETACSNAYLLDDAVLGALGELWFHQSRSPKCARRSSALQRARGYLVSRLEVEVPDEEVASHVA